MSKRIIYQNDAGGVSIIIPAPGAAFTLEQRAQSRGLTVEEYLDKAFSDGWSPQDVERDMLMTIEEIAAKDVPKPKVIWDVPTGVFEIDEDTGEQYEVMGSRLHEYKYKIVDAADIPADRSYRKDWELGADGAIKNANPGAASVLAGKREAAEISHEDFLIGAVDAGLISEAVAEEAADGTWPQEFNAFLSGLSARDRVKAKAKWARSSSVSRNDPLLENVAKLKIPDSAEREAALDNLFGISD